MRRRGTEESETAVAREILDRATELLHRMHHPRNRLTNDQARLLRIEPLGDRRRTHQVGGKSSDDSAFLTHRRIGAHRPILRQISSTALNWMNVRRARFMRVSG